MPPERQERSRRRRAPRAEPSLAPGDGGSRQRDRREPAERAAESKAHGVKGEPHERDHPERASRAAAPRARGVEGVEGDEPPERDHPAPAGPAAVPRARSAEGDEPHEGDRPAPAARGVWSGSITFGLVSVPVDLYSAVRPHGISLRMLSPDGVPLARQYVCSADGQPLEPGDIQRGYEIAPGEVVVVTDEELEALAPRRSRDIDLGRFVDRGAIDPAYFIRGYYLVPSGEQTKAYRLLAETMEASGRAGLATFVMRGKSYGVAIFATRRILRAEILRHADEVRSPADVGLPEPVAPEPERVRAMSARIRRLSADALDEAELVDDSVRALFDLAEEKKKRGVDVVEAPEVPAEDEEAGGDVIDLMALLKQRLAEDAARREARPKAPAPSTARPSAKKQGKKREAKKREARAATRDLEMATKKELLERARALGVPGRTRMDRAELLRSIRRAA